MIKTNTPMHTDIAIVGMSALFPGSKDVHAFWQNIFDKVDYVKDAPDDWVGPYFDPEDSELDRIYTCKVGLLGKLAKFNPFEFGVVPNSVTGAEPDHFLALKLARDALGDAGYLDKKFDNENTGVILGRGATPNRGTVTGLQYGVIVQQTVDLIHKLFPELNKEKLAEIRKELKTYLPALPPEAGPGLVSNVAVGRIANRLDLNGPSYIVDAACASSLIAVETAIKELCSHRCDMMLAGGVQASMTPQIYMLFCQLNALSRTKIRPFDQEASGTVLGEGVGFLVLKRRSDAERDGDRIYAIVKQVGLSSDGKALGLLAPRLEGEVLALRRAYSESSIDPSTVDLVEAHGTGIPLGDETEFKALSKIFGARGNNIPRCAVGSVKSMIGHCIPAAGIASLIKTTLALYHKILPATICDNIKKELQIENTPFYINTQNRPWIHGNKNSPRRACVNAFGFGGTNAHAILEEYSGKDDTHCKQLNSSWPSELIILSGNTRQHLIENIQEICKYIQKNPETNLSHLAYTLSENKIKSHRLSIVAHDPSDLTKKLNKVLRKISQSGCNRVQGRNGVYYAADSMNTTKSKTAFLFPGEGSQYANMLADLCIYFPKVRAWFDLSDATFEGIWEHLPSKFVFPPSTSLTQEESQLLSDGLMSVDIATEVVFTAGMALYDLLSEFGIKPDVMVGHSTGEYTGLLASGLFPGESEQKKIELKRRLNLIYKEFESADKIPRGALLSVGAIGSDFIQKLVESSNGTLHLAMDNCPNQQVLFSSLEDVDILINKIKEQGGICQILPFDRAYHTPLFAEMGSVLQTYYKDITIGTADTELYSCANSEPFPKPAEEVRALAAQQWSTTVNFRQTIDRLYADNVRTFIEVGPKNNLTSFVEDILRKRDFLAIASNIQSKPGLEQLQRLLGQLLVEGVNIDLSPLYKYRQLNKIDFETINQQQDNGKRYDPVLDMSIPTMTISQETVTQIRAKGSETLQKNTKLKTNLQKENEVDNTPNKSHEIPVLNTDLKVEKQNGEVMEIVDRHFELMQDFLSNQARVTEAYFSNKTVANDSKDIDPPKK